MRAGRGRSSYAHCMEEPEPQPRAREDANVGGHAVSKGAGDVIARAQHFVDSRPKDAVPLAWRIEAMHVADLTALAALLISRELRLERFESTLSAMPPDALLTVTITVEPAKPQPSDETQTTRADEAAD